VTFVEHPAHYIAIPAVLPAVVVVGVILMIAIRDRREQRRTSDNGKDSE
jgi:hypothetical protein